MALSKTREENLTRALAIAKAELPNGTATEIVARVEEVITKGLPEADDAIMGTTPEEITLSDDLKKFINDGVNTAIEARNREAEVNRLVDERLTKYAGRPRNIAFPAVNETALREGGDLADFSITKYIKGVTNRGWNGAALEKAYFEKGLTGETDDDGGYTIPAPVASDVIARLYEEAILPRAGVTPIPIGRTQAMPIMTRGTTVQYGHREGTTITTSQTPKFGLVELVCKVATCLIPIPNELIEDSSVNIEQKVRADMAVELALDMDTKSLVGEGGTAPQGIWNQGIGKEVSVALASFAMSHVRAVFLAIRLAKSRGKAILTHPAVTDRLFGLEDSLGRPLLVPDLRDANVLRLMGVPIYDSVNCEVDGDYPFIVGDFSQEVMVGENGGLSIAADASAGFTANVTWLRAIRRWDIRVKHAAAIHGVLVTT